MHSEENETSFCSSINKKRNRHGLFVKCSIVSVSCESAVVQEWPVTQFCGLRSAAVSGALYATVLISRITLYQHSFLLYKGYFFTPFHNILYRWKYDLSLTSLKK
ncbi:hypothetical protein MTO96_032439 [Rhipicephalus appendiculatus]